MVPEQLGQLFYIGAALRSGLGNVFSYRFEVAVEQPASLETADLSTGLARFKLSAFRTGQEAVIRTVLSGQDCLCVMPTGGGKSLCYQLPAVVQSGLTLVVSPLIALMMDQVQQLNALGLKATCINSSIPAAEQQQRIDEMQQGAYDLVYVAAERFRSHRFREALSHVQLDLLAIDEAHCISQWGHDFRPDYAKLGQVRERLGNPTTIALTATATSDVRNDIVSQLQLKKPEVFVTGFARPNLHYQVQGAQRVRQKNAALVRYLRQNTGAGIVYTSTRKACEEVAAVLASETSRRVAMYHAGLLHEDRILAQEAFMSGQADVVVATNAFGMGIDKADVRFVVHYNLPGTLEAYYQEAGRAGRDGASSDCVLLYSSTDTFIQEFFIDSAYPSREVVARVYDFLRQHTADPIELTQQEIKQQIGINTAADSIGTCEQLLERAGVLRRLEPNQNMAIVEINSDLPTTVDVLPRNATVRRKVLKILERIVGGRRFEPVYFQPREVARQADMDVPNVLRALRELSELAMLDYVPPFRGRAVRMLERDKPFSELEIDFETLEARKQQEYNKLAIVIEFATASECREQVILRYFGQPEPEPCGRCDNCLRRGTRRHDPEPVDAEHPAVLKAVRIVLSGVARTKSRFGKNIVAQMLSGSTAAKITKFRLDELSTYGLLAFLRQEQVVEMMDALLIGGLLEQTEKNKHRPIIQLSDSGMSVMRGETARFHLAALPQEIRRALIAAFPDATETLTPAPQPTAASSPLAESPAAEKAKPAEEITQPPEADPAPASEVNTPNKPEARKSEAEQQSKPEAADLNGLWDDGLEDGDRPPHHWTWVLLQRGFTRSQCALVRSMSDEEVLAQLCQAHDEGLTLELEQLFDAATLARFQQVIGPGVPVRIRPLLAALPEGTLLEEVELFLKCRRP